jgi:hypothetical protein
MTAKEAKEKTLLVWRYLVSHPEISNKHELPGEFAWLFEYLNWCPLCEYAKEIYRGGDKICGNCILASCSIGGTLWSKWSVALNEEKRRAAAQAIVDKIMSWEVENDSGAS